MNCEIFKSNIDAWMDDELEISVRSEMEKHAEACPACKELMRQANMISQMCAELSEVDVPLPAQAAWRRAIRSEAKKKKNPMTAWTRGIASVAAAMVVLVMGTYSVRMNESVPASQESAITLAQDVDYNTMRSLENNQKDEREGGMVPIGGYAIAGLHSDGPANETRSLTTSDENNSIEAVVLRSAARSIESEHYDSDVQWLNDLVSEYDAWFEERSEMAASEDGTAGRVATAAVRVPSERLDDFLMELDQLGRTVMRSEAAEDVTGRYMDTQSRLNALKLQKEKLDEMMAAATSVEELISIDDKLTEVIGSMESLEGDLRRWESLRSYSRVELTLTEQIKESVQATASLGERMKEGFEESVEWLRGFGQDALVTLASAAPRLVVWIPAAVLVILLVCVICAKRRK